MGAAKNTEFAKKSGWNDMMEKSLASAKENPIENFSEQLEEKASDVSLG